MNKVWIGIVSVIAVFAFIFLAYKFTNTPNDKTFPELTTVSSSDHSKWATGSAAKKNVLLEFSDFQCPACKSFAEFIKAEIEASGSANAEIMKNVTFVYRHFPLAQHAQAEQAAYSAEAAGKQGKFFEYSDVLFAKQTDWGEKKDAVNKFDSYAKDLGLDMDKFKKDRDSQEVKDKVKADLLSGQQSEVNATPTFYFNGKKLGPINSFEDFLKPLQSLE